MIPIVVQTAIPRQVNPLKPHGVKKGYDFNFGVGHGMENASDQWLAKAIVVFPFK